MLSGSNREPRRTGERATGQKQRTSDRDGIFVPHALALGNRGKTSMKKMQIRLLMRLHGVTEAQAIALAALVWGAR